MKKFGLFAGLASSVLLLGACGSEEAAPVAADVGRAVRYRRGEQGAEPLRHEEAAEHERQLYPRG